MHSLNKTIFFILSTAMFHSLLFAQDADFYTFDAITSGTPPSQPSLRIDSGKVYRTKADLYWWERYDNEDVLSYEIRWGTQEGVYSDTLDLMDQLRPKDDNNRVDKLITLEPLTENTAYYALFFRDYNREPHYTEFRFNTPPLEKYSIRHHPVRRNVVSKNITAIEVYSIDGRRLFTTPVDKGTNPTGVWNNRKLSGLYIVTYKNESRFVRSEKIMIGN